MTDDSKRGIAARDCAARSVFDAKQHGLYLGDEALLENAAKAARIFNNQALMPMAALMAVCDRFAFDYIQQAPVLVLAAIAGKKGANKKYRIRCAQTWKRASEGRPKLRDLMHLYQLPVQLRALRGGALSPRYWPVVVGLAKLNPSTLAQIIPQKDQMAFLRRLRSWMDSMNRRIARQGQQQVLHFEWIARQLGTNADLRKEPTGIICDMADFARSQPAFNPAWTWTQASAARDRWHEGLGQQTGGAAAASLGVNPDHKVGCSPFREEMEFQGYQFVALCCVLDLYAEGMVMHHCVGSYAPDVLSGVCRIISMRDKDGKRIATAEFRQNRAARPIPVLEPTAAVLGPVSNDNFEPQKAVHRFVWPWELVQFKAHCNTAPSQEHGRILERFRKLANDAQLHGGYTSAQIKTAPKEAIFICCDDNVGRIEDRAQMLGRRDIFVMPASNVDDREFATWAVSKPCVFDHAFVMTDKNRVNREIIMRGIQYTPSRWRDGM